MGKVGFFEGLSILIGILWLLGFLRLFIVPIRTQTENPSIPETKKKSPPISDQYGNDAEFVDYEELD